VIRQDSAPLRLEVQHRRFRSVEAAYYVVQSELAVSYLLRLQVREGYLRPLEVTVVQPESATSYPLLLQVQGDCLRVLLIMRNTAF